MNLHSERIGGGVGDSEHWREWFRVRSDERWKFRSGVGATGGLRECDWQIQAADESDDWEIEVDDAPLAGLGRAGSDRSAWLEDDPE